MDRNDPNTFDAVIIGGGAAGLFCAGVGSQRGLKILVIDHSAKLAEKVRISGGGRCNFTNRDMEPRLAHTYFHGENPQFCTSALTAYTPQSFISLLDSYDVPYYEKHKGQLFCKRSSQDIIDVLLSECQGTGSGMSQKISRGSTALRYPCKVETIESPRNGSDFYRLHTSEGEVRCKSLVIACGGLSIAQIGASDFGYRVAKQFNLPVVATRPALVPLTFDEAHWAPFARLSGLSLPVQISTGARKTHIKFAEDLLFTHRGLSGPGVLQISSYWTPEQPIQLNLCPEFDLGEALLQAKSVSRKSLLNTLSQWLPIRLAELWIDQKTTLNQPINQIPDAALLDLAKQLHSWSLEPSGTEGYRKAEVTAGGVSTKALSQKTMESTQPGLYFIGEVVDITGWLGGYNFQWAWASGFACGQSLPYWED